MQHLYTAFEVPDPSQPPVDDDSPFGPSGDLVPFTPAPLEPAAVLSQRVDEVNDCFGTYGMGTPGFFGLRLGEAWLVVALWGASDWMRLDGRLVSDAFAERHGRPRPWLPLDRAALRDRLLGAAIAAVDVRPRALTLEFTSGARLWIDEDPNTRPILEGSKEPRRLAPDDDLRRAVFLSPTDELWI
ncbi:MAG: hypothetical protein KC486_07790 [Myxococcales bacterium]|nr:hypothetical protein [Myxococcales bacterium]